MTLTVEAKKVDDIIDMVSKTTGRRDLGKIYFEKSEIPNKYVIRVISQETDVTWLKAQIKAGNIFLPDQRIDAQPF